MIKFIFYSFYRHVYDMERNDEERINRIVLLMMVGYMINIATIFIIAISLLEAFNVLLPSIEENVFIFCGTLMGFGVYRLAQYYYRRKGMAIITALHKSYNKRSLLFFRMIISAFYVISFLLMVLSAIIPHVLH